MADGEIRNFLEISYDKLEELNLEAKQKVAARVCDDDLREHYVKYLTDERRIKALTVCFSDLEGRFHMLDYDKKYLLRSCDNLTFDGSSIHGFSQVRESDLRLAIDWGSFRWLPSDIFGPGKVLVFGLILDQEGRSYSADMRGRLKHLCDDLYKEKRLMANVSVECEGFLFEGINAEQHFSPSYSNGHGFKLVSSGGYFHSLPKDPLKLFIDTLAEAQRALGFENEKDHPEVAPSQFELNYRYCDALQAADQIQLYKLTARQVADSMGMTACFLPKPIAGINGSGMHCNFSFARDGENLFYDKDGEGNLSPMAWDIVARLLNNAKDLCLIFNSSVNAYRRLDSAYEAPNKITVSTTDRTSMVRIPLGNAQTSRLEVRSVAPDANPYLTMLALIKTSFEGPLKNGGDLEEFKRNEQILPSNIYDAIDAFGSSDFITAMLGEECQAKYLERKVLVATRSPRELGNWVKRSEILFHHEVTDQHIWNEF